MIDQKQVWTPSQADFDAFARVSGDDNAIHVDPAFCATTAFGRPVSHGMLLYTKLWGMLRRRAPEFAIELQSLMFPNPAFAGEPLELHLQQTEPVRVQMRARRVADGAVCLVGEARLAC